MNIFCIITGGTIDKQYNSQSGQLHFTSSSVQALFKQSRSTQPIHFKTLFLKDSLDHTEEDKQQIVTCCKNSLHKKIIITHGTDTMTETALQLYKQCFNKTIVLVGSMIPYSIKHSDAGFNLGAASIAVQLLPHGVYIVMNGQIFEASNVTKNYTLGVFETLKS